MTLLTIPLIHNIVKDIKCKGFSIEISDDSGRPIMQIKQGKWKGRKWFLSPHMCKSEVVQTAFMAIMAYNEHELREAFKYKKKAIFGPHYDVDKLVALCSQNNHLDYRK